MATHLRSPLTPLSLLQPKANSTSWRPSPVLPIRCGPRDNRGPLVKGRILSIEAIHAVQSLKLAHNNRKFAINDPQITRILSRLIKSDLLAVLNELLRQNHCHLALRVFSAVRSEPRYTPDLAMYATLVRALEKNGMAENIDCLIGELEVEVEASGNAVDWGDQKSLVKLIRAVAEAERKESTVRIYGMMKRCGVAVDDEYVAKVLGRGLRRFQEVALAEEVERAYQISASASLGRVGAS